jgi:hypothetical protein
MDLPACLGRFGRGESVAALPKLRFGRYSAGVADFLGGETVAQSIDSTPGMTERLTPTRSIGLETLPANSKVWVNRSAAAAGWADAAVAARARRGGAAGRIGLAMFHVEH